MPTYKLTVEYCGTNFNGWATQPGQRTVENVLTLAIETVLSEQVKLTVAGRTDTGVHAWGQVVSFESSRNADAGRLKQSLSGVLSHDIAVLDAELAPDSFDARKDARTRTYCYRVFARSEPSPFERERALWWPQELDHKALKSCAKALKGTHDFTAFTPTQTDHVRFDRRVMRTEWRCSDSLLEFWIEADTFMRHMVRVLVGTMLEVGSGRREVTDFKRLLQGAPRADAGPTAEPHGLYLAAVSY